MSEPAGSTKITRRFQVTIPKKVRNAMELKEGDVLFVFVDPKKKEIIFKKM